MEKTIHCWGQVSKKGQIHRRHSVKVSQKLGTHCLWSFRRSFVQASIPSWGSSPHTPPPLSSTHTPRNLVHGAFDPLINLRHFLPLNYYFMTYLIFSTLYCFRHKFVKRNLQKKVFNGQDLKNCVCDLFSFFFFFFFFLRFFVNCLVNIRKHNSFLLSYLHVRMLSSLYILHMDVPICEGDRRDIVVHQCIQRVWDNLVHFCENLIWRYIFFKGLKSVFFFRFHHVMKKHLVKWLWSPKWLLVYIKMASHVIYGIQLFSQKKIDLRMQNSVKYLYPSVFIYWALIFLKKGFLLGKPCL